MPVPQPTVRGAGQYEALQGNVQAVQQGLNTVAQSAMFNRNLREEQRQFDVTNRLQYYNDVVQNQYGGNWAAFIRGPQTGENSYAGNEVARQMFTDLYGENADQLYSEARQATPETIQQMTQSILNEAYLKGTGQNPPQRTQPPSRENQIATESAPVAPQNTEPAGSFKATAIPQPGTEIVPGSSEGGTVDAVSGAAYASPEGAGGGSETLAQIYGEFLGMDPAVVQSMLDEPAAAGSMELVAGIANLSDQEQQAFNQRVRRMRAGQGQGQGQQGQPVQPNPATYNVNTPAEIRTTTTRNNIPVAPGQENAVFPLNSATFSGMDVRVERPADATEKEYNSAIAQSLASWARETVLSTTGDPQKAEEAARFMGRATRSLTEEDMPDYEQKAREFFGVSGDEFITMRNLVFENNKKGNPPGTIPENLEQKEWVWGVISDPEKATVVTATLDDVEAATDEQKQEAGNVLADDPRALARANTVDPNQVRKLVEWYGETYPYNDKSADNYMDMDARIAQAAKAYGLPVGAVRDIMLPGKEPETFTNREQAAFGRLARSGPRIARKAINSSTSTPLHEALQTTDDRRQEIYNEIKLYTQGHPEMLSPEVLASMPDSLVESRRFESQLGLEERRMTLEEKKGEAYIESLAADTAYKQAQLDLQKKMAELEAEDPEMSALATAIKVSEPIYNKYIDNVMKSIQDRGGSFSADKYIAEITKLRNNDAAFRDAERMHVEMMGLLTGQELSEAELEKRKGLLVWLGFRNATPEGAVAQPQLFQTQAPSAVAPASTGYTEASSAVPASGNRGVSYAENF